MAAEDAIDFKAIFDANPSPLLVLSPDLTIVHINGCYTELLGGPHAGPFGPESVGRSVFDIFPGPAEARERVRASLRRALTSGKTDSLAVLPVAVPTTGSHGTTDNGHRCWSCSHVPIKARSGAISHVLQNAQDITEIHRTGLHRQDEGLRGVRGMPNADRLGTTIMARAERVQALNSSLLAESAQLRNLFMRAPSFMCLLRGQDYRFELANIAFMDLVGQRTLIGRPFRDAIPEVDGQLYIDLLDKVFRTGEPFVGKQMRAEFERVPGHGPEEVFISFVLQPIFGDDGKVFAIFVDGNDVTDHVRAERSQAMLVRELHHRVRNTLATVQGVMNSTARTAETIEDYQWAFSGRISSLARTHSLLTEEIQQFVSFPHLLRQEIGVYAEGASDRVVLEGPDVELPSQLAVPLGMTIHELTTNAFRHGALSSPDGRVTVTWSVQPAKEKRILICHWTEQGGPPVTPPARHGFGSMILTRVLTQQIGAKVDATYPPEGFELRADIPLVLERI